MKASEIRILPALLLTLCWAATSRAQQGPPNPPPPPEEQNPPARPPGGIRNAVPPMPKLPDVRQPGETGFWLGVIVWFPTQSPVFDKGQASTFTDPSRLTMQGKPNSTVPAELGIAAGQHNTVHLSYFENRASGNVTNTQELQVWNQTYAAGNLVSTNYQLRNLKALFEFLTWPYPVEERKFRLKTLWGVAYTQVKTGFDLPLLPLTDSAGNPIVDASGNPVNYQANGNKSVVLPSIGIQVQDYLTRHVRLEGNASGFGVPKHGNEWDADASVNLRAGHWELRVGAKAFHFETSRKADFFLRATQASGFVGLRWYWD